MSHRPPLLTGKIEIIEVLRGLASLAVVLFHMTNQMTGPITVIIHSYGWLGVHVFFVISGCVIPLALYNLDYKTQQFPRFFLKRLVRLEPAYLSSIILTLVLWYLSSLVPAFKGQDPVFEVGRLLAHFFYLIPFTEYVWYNDVYWTLAYEFVFYITAGLTFCALINRPLELTIFLGIAFVGLLYWLDPETVNVLVTEFLIGGLLMRALVGKDPVWRSLIWIAVLMVFILYAGGSKIGYTVIFTVALIWIFRSRKFGRAALFLGAISYSLYLIHIPVGGRVINLGQRFGDGDLFDLALVLAGTIVSVVFATLFWRFFEVPALGLSRRIKLTKTSHAP